MDTIFIAVKFTNRKLGGRVYQVSGASFAEMKDAIKTLRGQFDLSKKYWLVSNDARKALKEKFSVVADDFNVSYYDDKLIRAEGLEIISVNVAIESRFKNSSILYFSTKTRENAEQAVARFIAAYSESDEKMIEVGKELVG